MHSYIDAIGQTGVDAIKFQTHIAEAESSRLEPFRVKFSYEDESRFDYWKRMSFDTEVWVEIKGHCEDVGLEFMSSPFSIAAVDLLEQLGMKRYKIGSGEVNNHLLLKRIVQTGKPVILSSGMSSFEELDESVDFIKKFDIIPSLLQCTTSYPTPPEQVGLNVIQELKKRYPESLVGLSDHSGSIYPSLAAASLGAEIIECHVTFDRRMFGPDSTSSITIDELTELVKGIRMIETMLNNPVHKNDTQQYKQLKAVFGKSLAVNKNLSEGHIIQEIDLETKKPASEGILAADFSKVVGSQLKVSKSKYDFLKYGDLIINA